MTDYEPTLFSKILKKLGITYLLNRFSYWLGSIFTKIGRKLQGIK